MKMQFKESTALVTGAAKRLGREITLSLAKKGANVVIHYRSSEKAAVKLKHNLLKLGVQPTLLSADLKNSSELEQLIPKAVEKADGIDFLVNNAAVFPDDTIKELKFEELIENIRINTWAPFFLTRMFVNYADSGKIVNLLDTRVAGFDWDHSGYYMSKVLLTRLTKMLAVKYAPNFTVNGVAPGLILPPESSDEEYLEERIDRVPLKKHGDKKDIAKAVTYLLSSDFVTGQILYVDGGRNLLHELEG